MPGEWVVDASVAAKVYFLEEQTELARVVLRTADRLIAPALFNLEMASIAAKRSRRGMSPHEVAAEAVRAAPGMIDESVPLADLASRAFEFAVAFGFSVYDGTYLALAELRELKLLTADLKLARRAREAGLAHLVHILGEAD